MFLRLASKLQTKFEDFTSLISKHSEYTKKFVNWMCKDGNTKKQKNIFYLKSVKKSTDRNMFVKFDKNLMALIVKEYFNKHISFVEKLPVSFRWYLRMQIKENSNLNLTYSLHICLRKKVTMVNSKLYRTTSNVVKCYKNKYLKL